ncbi:MAG: glycosyltransferase family 4 protein [Acidobacteria bacterium]|nr:glycosyltransferase family 4 protein [Acidobacteriota bacterium]
MHFAIDATTWTNARGYGRFTRSLVAALVNLEQPHRYTLFTDTPGAVPELPSRVDVQLVASDRPAALAASAEGRRGILDMLRMSRALSGASCDCLLFPTAYSYVPILSRAPVAVVFHDVIAERFPELTVPSAGARWMWNTKVRLARMQAGAVITVSDYSRRELARQFRLDERSIQVVSEAADPVFRAMPSPEVEAALQPLALPPGPLVVYAGGFGPHKNVPMLVEAFASVGRRYPAATLVLVGENKREVFHSEIGRIDRLVESRGILDRVRFTGFLPDAVLAALLNRAWVLVLPSLMEGFGLPAIEAAACGCAVIATRESPLPALLAGGGIFIDPNQPAELEAALEAVLASDGFRSELAQHALCAASELTWRNSAIQMLSILEAAAGGR